MGMDTGKVLMDKEQIESIIPHREPMLLVDNILEMDAEERIKSDLYIDPGFKFFDGHFPGNPIMPGVLTVEAMAQTAAVLLLSTDRYAGKTPLFIGIDQVRFIEKIVPGDTIEIEAKIVKANEPKAVVTCEAAVYNKGDLTTTGLVTLAIR